MVAEREADEMEMHGAPAASASESGGAAQPEIELQQLAERVYRLMCAEARLERARGQQPGRSS
ncbi:MAG: hypothetical protein ACREEM_39120 [Blastocatellia bacterium]